MEDLAPRGAELGAQATGEFEEALVPEGPVVQDLNELLLVKGITPELFYGTTEIPGIMHYLTPYGMAPGEGTSVSFPGRINITTAERRRRG